MFEIIHPTDGPIARFDTLQGAGRFIATLHVACTIRALPFTAPDRDSLGLADTTFRPRGRPAGWTPLGPARYKRVTP